LAQINSGWETLLWRRRSTISDSRCENPMAAENRPGRRCDCPGGETANLARTHSSNGSGDADSGDWFTVRVENRGAHAGAHPGRLLRRPPRSLAAGSSRVPAGTVINSKWFLGVDGWKVIVLKIFFSRFLRAKKSRQRFAQCRDVQRAGACPRAMRAGIRAGSRSHPRRARSLDRETARLTVFLSGLPQLPKYRPGNCLQCRPVVTARPDICDNRGPIRYAPASVRMRIALALQMFSENRCAVLL